MCDRIDRVWIGLFPEVDEISANFAGFLGAVMRERIFSLPSTPHPLLPFATNARQIYGNHGTDSWDALWMNHLMEQIHKTVIQYHDVYFFHCGINGIMRTASYNKFRREGFVGCGYESQRQTRIRWLNLIPDEFSHICGLTHSIISSNEFPSLTVWRHLWMGANRLPVLLNCKRVRFKWIKQNYNEAAIKKITVVKVSFAWHVMCTLVNIWTVSIKVSTL